MRPPKGYNMGGKRIQNVGPARTSTVFDVVLLIASIIAGVVAWLIGMFLYNVLGDLIPRTLLIGIIFLLLYLILTAVVMIVSGVRGTLEDYVLFLDERWKVILFLVAGAVAVFGLGCLFQFLYSLNTEKAPREATSYVFLIDDSGSMEGNDPNYLRYEAINEILSGMPEDFPYMVYSFSDNTQILRDMKPISEGGVEITLGEGGGTSIKGALKQVMEDYENKVWTDNKAPRVILLTDGYATDIGLFSPIGGVLKKYARSNISVSTVSLGYVDKGLMQKIADGTNGVFLQVEDASLLKGAMEEAGKAFSDSRDLLSLRKVQDMDWLYGIMRVVFLTILGTLIGFLMIFAATKEDCWAMILISSTIKSFVGALLVELLVQLLGLPYVVTWLILWILIAALISTMEKEFRRGRMVGGGSTVSRY